MADAARPYRRWLRLRLLLLLPTLAFALGVNVWLAADRGRPAWLLAVSVVLSTLCLGATAYLFLEALACASLHAQGDRRRARLVRAQVAAHRSVTCACIAVLGVILVAPVLLPSAASEVLHVRGRSHPSVRVPVEPSPIIHDEAAPSDVPVRNPRPSVPEANPALAASASAAPPRPQIVPERADVPQRLEVTERDLEYPLATAPFLDLSPSREGPSATPESELPVFRPETLMTDALRLRMAVVEGVDRPGLPEDGSLPPPSLRLELMLVNLDGYGRGSAGRAEMDMPLGPSGSVRAEVLAVVFAQGSGVEEFDAQWSWTRLAVGYAHRLLGGTRHAVLDVTASGGIALDSFSVDDAEDLASQGRLSPFVAVDLGVWQDGNMGLLLRAGQSFAVNLTGATSAVTELAAIARADLTQRLSVYAGYRLLLVELREYSGAIGHKGGQLSFDDELAGPLMGLEWRF